MHTGFLSPGNLFPVMIAPAVSFGLTLFVSEFLCRFVPFLYLEDIPDKRKRHEGKIPLVGGLSIFTGLLVGCLLLPSLIASLKFPLFFSFLILLLGFLDDARDIRANFRLLAQLVIVLAFLYFSGLRLFSFGNLLFRGDIVFFTMSGAVSLFAFYAGINAFNMIDGIDGLAALMGLVALAALAVLFHPLMPDYFLFCILLSSCLLAFLCTNLRFFPLFRKIFLGDSGSMFLGFVLAFLLILASQGKTSGGETVMRPITSVWLIAIPLMDMVGIMLRRILRGQSPIRGDRNHLHHLLMDMGLSQRKTLFIMGLAAFFFAGVGLWGEIRSIPEGWMFFSYLFFFFLYALLVTALSGWVQKADGKGK